MTKSHHPAALFFRWRARSLPVLWLALLCAFAPNLLFSASAQTPTLAQQPSAATPESLESLRARLAAHVGQPRYAPAAWGVKVVSLDTGVILFEHNPEKYFSPASNAKLYTCALALNALGGEHRIKTSLYATARPDAEGTLAGDLLIYGRGDPSMAARWYGGDYFKGLDGLATALAAAGVRRITGDLIGDESYFIGPRLGSGWEWDDLQWYYGAESSALSLNDNSLDLFVTPAERLGLPCRITTGPQTAYVTLMNRTRTVAKGSPSRISVYRPVGENVIYVSGTLAEGDKGYTGYVAVSHPAGLFVQSFKEALAKRGITVGGRTRTVDWKYREVTPLDLSKLTELGVVESPPLKDIVREVLKPSNNLYAQLLLLQVGAVAQQRAAQAASGQPQVAPNAATPSPAFIVPDKITEEIGVEAMNAFLSEVGIKPGQVMLEEGSGLSRRNLITPAATTELLRFMSRHATAEAFVHGLPVAGVDGTLERRLKQTPAAGNVRAKTGTLRYVYALSGYLTTAAGERLAFSILLNNAYNAEKSFSAREDIDALVLMLVGFTGRSQPPVSRLRR